MRPIPILALLVAIAAPLAASAQSVPLQGGPWVDGHLPAYANSNSSQPVLMDGGTAAGGAPGTNPSEMGLTVRGTGSPPYADGGSGPNGENFCLYDGPITAANGYHYLCLSPNADGGGLLSFGADDPAPELPFYMKLNGVDYEFPFSLGGIVGPSTTVVGNIPLWNNTVGTLLSDSGRTLPTFADGLTATGANQGTALSVNHSTNAFRTVAASTGAILSLTDSNGNAATSGYTVSIVNSGANPLNVYPPSGQSINGGSANAAVTIHPNGTANFIYRGGVANDWYAR